MTDVEKQLRSLLRARTAVISHLDLRDVLQAIVESAVDLLDARYGALAVMGPDAQVDDFVHVGMPAEIERLLEHPPRAIGVLGAVLEADGVLSIRDVATDPRTAGFPAHHPEMHSFAGVAIRVRGEVFGNLYIADDHAGGFDVGATEALESLAATAGIAIDNARHFAEAERREAWTAAAAELTSTLLGGHTVNAPTLLAERVSELTGAPIVVVAETLDADNVCLDVVVGDDTDHLQGLVTASAGTLIGDALDADSVTVRAGGEFIDIRLGPWFAVPLTTPSGHPAVLLVARDRDQLPFPPTTIELTEDLASRASIAFELARARADQERLAVHEDRGRIARDLHDHVIQRLFGAGLSLQSLSASTTDEHVRHALPEQIDALDQAISEIRTVIFALRQRGDAQPTLRHRVIDLISEFEPHLVHTPRLMFGGTVDLSVRDELADDVVAVVREALSNIVRHAQARHVRVVITAREHEVSVEVTDDGVGLPGESTRRSGTGNLEARALARGGAFRIETLPTGGTALRWSAPTEQESP